MTVEHPTLPDRGWYTFLGAISMIAGVVMLAWPFTSLGLATVVAGVWLVVIGVSDIAWALRARTALVRLGRGANRLTGSPAAPATQA